MVSRFLNFNSHSQTLAICEEFPYKPFEEYNMNLIFPLCTSVFCFCCGDVRPHVRWAQHKFSLTVLQKRMFSNCRCQAKPTNNASESCTFDAGSIAWHRMARMYVKWWLEKCWARYHMVSIRGPGTSRLTFFPLVDSTSVCDWVDMVFGLFVCIQSAN